MAIRKVHFDPFALDRLMVKLSEKTGYVLTNKPDCVRLSELLVQQGYSYLSESTLYRLFFQPDKHAPYKNTLDVLCRFAGYSDSLDFLENLEPERAMLHRNGINTLEGTPNSLLFFCIENQSEKPLIDFFEQIATSPQRFKESISVSLFDSLLKNSQTDWFFRSFAHQTYIREYFLEKGHDPKFRIKHYDLAYLHYLEKIDIFEDAKKLQDFIFGNCVLFRYYFLKGDLDRAISIGANLYKPHREVESLGRELEVFPVIRFAAYRLWYLQLTECTDTGLADYALYLLELCEKLRAGLGWDEKKILFHTIAETLLYSRLPESYHQLLKQLFAQEYQLLPEAIFGKHLKYSLPYFDMNGLLNHRP